MRKLIVLSFAYLASFTLARYSDKEIIKTDLQLNNDGMKIMDGDKVLFDSNGNGRSNSNYRYETKRSGS
jgi:5'(3')-deoxyribonucleotidase